MKVNETNSKFTDLGKKIALTQKDAINRHKLVISQSNYDNDIDAVRYKLHLNLTSKKQLPDLEYNFLGVVDVSFMFYGNSKKDLITEMNTETNVFLNFYGFIEKIYVNGVSSDVKFSNQMLYISNEHLKVNERNNLRIFFHGLYNYQGVGIHYYLDPKDQKEYLYSQFEPYDCSRLFPCFDQPNIKSTLDLTVITPESWNVFANEDENNVINLCDFDGIEYITKCGISYDSDIFNFLQTPFSQSQLTKSEKYKLTAFPSTPKISCYLFALCAGEYIIYENIVQPNFKIKMRVMYRESLKPYADPNEIISVTIKGINYYEKYFGIDYPFRKYDQIFCPEYNMGAMENVGLVVYNECYVWKSKPSERRKNGYTITILHELAHMWFGNLVTMDWWDDLWLNESFATFISHICLDFGLKENKNYALSWELFNYYKGFAYKEDQSPNTHPVMGECENTDVTENNFDSITYEKGASLLKQIYYYLGHENFSKAINSYFKKYAYKNTVFENFIDELESVKKGVKELSISWLAKSGLTSITPELVVEDGKLQKFNVIQKPCLSDHPNLQTLILDILLIYDDHSQVVHKNLTVKPEEITSFNQLCGGKIPVAVLLNHSDWSYVKLILDENSIKYFKHNLQKLTDVLSRQMVFRSFFDMVRDALISGNEYIDLLVELLKEETNEDIISPQLRYLSGAISNYLPNEYFIESSAKIFELCLDLLHKFTGNDDMANTILQLIYGLAETENHQKILLDWLNNEHDVDGVKKTIYNYNNKKIVFNVLSDEIKINIIKKLYGSKFLDQKLKDEILNQQLNKDPSSDDSIELSFYCKGALNDVENKKLLWDKFVNNPNSESLVNMSSIMSGFARRDQENIIKNYLINNFFEDIEKVGKENDPKYVQAFVGNLNPEYFVNDEILKKMENKVEELKHMDVVKKEMYSVIDIMRRKLASYKATEKYLSKN